MERNCKNLLKNQWAKKLFLCVGLDSDLEEVRKQIPQERIESDAEAVAVFNRKIIEATSEYACAYKINTAFYEKFRYGFDLSIPLTMGHCHSIAPNAAVIIDGKRGDIGNSMKGYVEMVLRLGGDALTCPVGMGEESLFPLLSQTKLCAFALCRTSNPGAKDFQERLTFVCEYELIALFQQNSSLNSLNLDDLSEVAQQFQWQKIQAGSNWGYLLPAYQLIALKIKAWNSSMITRSSHAKNAALAEP